ncbi:MAG: GPR endopeptidase [Sarcina sp.]
MKTDLVKEKKDIYQKHYKKESDGIIVKEELLDDIKITNVEIVNKASAKRIGKEIGKYITIDMPFCNNYDIALKEQVMHILAGILESLIENIDKNKPALIVGLGNSDITSDAIGPKSVSKILVTRHIGVMAPEEMGKDGLMPVCAISPGVLGTTGIESGDIIKSIVDKIDPSVVICIDSLSSMSLSRISKSIQITNTGISPGAGVGNTRMQINKKNLGIPVIAIGVPTVIDASIIANEAIELTIDELIEKTNDKKLYTVLRDIDKLKREEIIKELLSVYMDDFMVTPKNVNEVIDCISSIVASGINIALQPNVDIVELIK